MMGRGKCSGDCVLLLPLREGDMQQNQEFMGGNDENLGLFSYWKGVGGRRLISPT